MGRVKAALVKASNLSSPQESWAQQAPRNRGLERGRKGRGSTRDLERDRERQREGQWRRKRGEGEQDVEGGDHRAGAARGQRLQGPAPGAAAGHGRAPPLVLLPRPHRRVCRHPALPLRHRGHRHRPQEAGRPLRRRRPSRHRLGLRRHDLYPRLLHCRHLRWAHQPGGDLRAVPGEEGVAVAGVLLHGGAVPGGHLRGRAGEGLHEEALQHPRRRRQRGRPRLLQGHRPRRRDHRHLRPRLHRLLRHRPQAQRPRLPRPGPGAAPHRLRSVHGPSGYHPHHRHRHQPRQEFRRRRHLQPGQGLGRPVDLLGRALRRRPGGGGLPPVHPEGGSHQGPGVLPQQPEQLMEPKRGGGKLLHRRHCHLSLSLSLALRVVRSEELVLQEWRSVISLNFSEVSFKFC